MQLLDEWAAIEFQLSEMEQNEDYVISMDYYR